MEKQYDQEQISASPWGLKPSPRSDSDELPGQHIFIKNKYDNWHPSELE